MAPLTARRILLVACVLGSLWLLYGCATPDADGWKSEPTHNALPAVFRVSTLDQVEHCTRKANTIGCASRDYARGFCYVMVPSDAPLWLLAHELLHCAGFDHE